MRETKVNVAKFGSSPAFKGQPRENTHCANSFPKKYPCCLAKALVVSLSLVRKVSRDVRGGRNLYCPNSPLSKFKTPVRNWKVSLAPHYKRDYYGIRVLFLSLPSFF